MSGTVSDTKGETPELEASAGSHVICEFTIPGCDHASIFLDEYLRTNRTNHTKIMRCFPHCCPGHRVRSYCGSPLHVRVRSDSTTKDSQLVVYCRFRPVDAAPHAIGDRIAVKSIQSSLQSVDPSTGEWIESRRSRHETEPHLFEVNPSSRWYYPWSGAATIAMRSTTHVFEAIVFNCVSASELEVIAQTSSPKFGLKSFRRSITQSRKRQIEDSDSPRGKRMAVTRTASPTDSISSHTQQYVRSTTDDASAGSTLDSLVRWLQKLPASSVGSQLMLAWQRLVDDACEAQILALRDPTSNRSGLVSILSALDVSASNAFAVHLSTTSTTHEEASTPLNMADVAVRVLLNEWLSVDCTRASNRAMRRSLRNCHSLTSNELLPGHRHWLEDAEERARRFVGVNTTVPWTRMTETLSQLDSQRQLSDPMGDFGEFSYRSFVAKCRERLISRSRRVDATVVPLERTRTETPHQSFPTGSRPEELNVSSRVWRCSMEDVAIDLDGMGEQGLTLLTVVQFWKHLSCVTLDYSPAAGSTATPVQLSVASVFNSQVRDGGFTRLILDGQNRWFNCLPSGEPTIGTTLMGYVVGDYVGRATSAGTFHITAYLWPATTETSTAYAWHWTLDSASLSSQSSSSVVSVVVESASVARTPHAMEIMSNAEKLRYVGRWQHACELQLVYKTH